MLSDWNAYIDEHGKPPMGWPEWSGSHDLANYVLLRDFAREWSESKGIAIHHIYSGPHRGWKVLRVRVLDDLGSEEWDECGEYSDYDQALIAACEAAKGD